jgi:hypothetical protein
MKCLLYLVLGLGIGLVALDVGGAPPTNKKNPTPDSTDDGGIFTASLIAKDLLLKLKLTAEQKPEVDKIQKEFADKLKDIAAKAKVDAADKSSAPAFKGKGKGKGMTKGGGDAPGVSDAISLRNDCEDKVFDLLTEAQQNIWLEVKAKKGESLLTGGNSNTTNSKPKK